MNYDIIIVGGAMAGASLALALNSQTQGAMKIAVLEKQPMQQHQQSGFDARSIALSAGSCQRFAQIQGQKTPNLWAQIQQFASPIQQIHVSDRGHAGMLQFSAEEFQLPHLGAVVELSQMGNLLLNEIQHCAQIDYFCPLDIEYIELEANQVKILAKKHRTLGANLETLETEAEPILLQAKLLVGADGNHSAVAKVAGIEQQLVREYAQTAIITNVRTQQPHQQRAFERFTAQGPIALLPMADNLLSLVWCVKDPQPLLAMNEQDFLAQLQQAFGWRLGKFEQAGQRHAYPLNLTVANQHVQPRVALVGNAAQTLHPVAGQGFNLGIRDLMTLAEIIGKAFLAGRDIGDYGLLQQYAQARQPDQQRMLNLTDALLSIFANDLLPCQLGRNLGLMALAQSSALRQYFAKPTLGWL